MKYIASIMLFLISTLSFGQNTDEIESQLAGYLNKITYYKYDVPNSDSVEIENSLFKKLLLKYITDNPSTLTGKMDTLIKAGLTIATSKDGAFRIYSWDTQTGGTMRFYDNVYQYKADDKIYNKAIEKDTSEYPDPGSWYSEIYTMNDNGKKYYLAVYNSEYSTREISQGIKFFSIDSDVLNTDLKLAKTSEGLYNALGVALNFFTLEGHDERPLKLVLFNIDKKSISVPVVTDDGKLTNKFTVYKYRNGLFEEVK